jgi:glycerol-3-phosphate acyltransferase PlsY
LSLLLKLGASASSYSQALLDIWWLPLASYLLGSIPFGYLAARTAGKGDIRKRGSGNIGATNVTRVAGWFPGMLTLLLDAGKGYFAVWLAARMTGGSIRWMVLAGLLALVGHQYPVWLGFRGGRGVATGVGIYLPVCWQAVAVAVVVWIAVVAFWRYVSLASVTAAASLPLLIYLLYAPGHAPPAAVSAGTSAAMVLIILRHQPNIVRLLSGTEPKFTLRRDLAERAANGDAADDRNVHDRDPREGNSSSRNPFNHRNGHR